LKRLSAILFLLILVFNFYGYRLVISYMEENNSITIEQSLDKKEYQEAELLSIKTALHLPYYSSSPHYERAYGSVTFNGVVYEYVKKRVYHDTLELLCLPNASKTKLQEVKNNLAQSAADVQTSYPVKKGATSTLKILWPDFFQTVQPLTFLHPQQNRTYGGHRVSIDLSSFYTQQDRPPQAPLANS
jgi:hypothetical protein